MDKNTLSQYGWVIICIMVLAIMIGLATPFGNFVKQSVDNTIHSFGDKVVTSLNQKTKDDEVVWRIEGFTYEEEYEGYFAPLTGSLPDIEPGIYQININGEIVEGCVSRYKESDEIEVMYIASQGTPKIWIQCIVGKELFEQEIIFYDADGMAQSLLEVGETVELKFTRPENIVDYGIYIESSFYEGSASFYAYYDKTVFKNDKNATYEFEIYDGEGELMFKPSWSVESAVGYSEESGRFVFSTNGIGREEFAIIQDSINNDKPMTIICKQILSNGEVLTKTIKETPIIRNDVIYFDGEDMYCWGNVDAFVLGL